MDTLHNSRDYFQRLVNSLADAVFLIKLPEVIQPVKEVLTAEALLRRNNGEISR